MQVTMAKIWQIITLTATMTEERQHGTYDIGKNRSKQKEEQQLQFVHSEYEGKFLFEGKNIQKYRDKKSEDH